MPYLTFQLGSMGVALMVELDNQDPRVQATLERLIQRLSHFVTHEKSWSLMTVLEAEDLMERTRSEFKILYGYDFPRLTAFYMPSIALLLFYRADLDYPVIRDNMVILSQKLARRGIKINPVEMSEAMMRCWPHIVKRDSGADEAIASASAHHIKHSQVMN